MDDELDSVLDPLAAQDDEGVQVPMAPPRPDPENDSKNRFKEYLEGQLRVNDRRQSPEAMDGRAAQRDRIEDVKGEANLGSLLMDSAAKFGMAGGKQVESDYGKYAQGLRGDLDKYQAGNDQMQARNEAVGDKQAKLLQYLAAQQQQGEGNKLKQYIAETQRKKLDVPDYGTPLQDSKTGQVQAINRRTGKLENIGQMSPKPEESKLTETQRVDEDGNALLFNAKTGTYQRAGAGVMPKPANGGKDKDPTADQFKAAGFGKRMEQAESVMNDLAEGGYNRADNIEGLKSSYLPGFMQKENPRRQEQAERNFINAVLRRESGAAIGKDEYSSGEQQYFPRPGDTAQVLAQKKANRQQAVETMKAESGNAYAKVPSIIVPKVASPDASGTATAAPAAGGKQVVKQQYSPSRNQTRITYSDGTTEVKDGR